MGFAGQTKLHCREGSTPSQQTVVSTSGVRPINTWSVRRRREEDRPFYKGRHKATVFRSHVKVGDGDSILIWRAIDRLFVWWQAAEIIGSAAAATGGRGVTGARFRRVLRPTAGEAKTMSPSGAVRNQKGRVVPAPVGRSGLWGSESTRTLGYVPFGVWARRTVGKYGNFELYHCRAGAQYCNKVAWIEHRQHRTAHLVIHIRGARRKSTIL